MRDVENKSRKLLKSAPSVGGKPTVTLSPASAQATPGRALDPFSAVAGSPIVKDLQGVGGWLLFFCITTTILTPLGNVAGLIRLARFSSPWALYYCALVGFSFIVGMTVWRVMPSAIPLVRIYFITFAMWELFRITYLVVMSPDPSMDLPMIMRIRNVIWVAIWAAYFHKSQRVRTTFGRNL